MILETTFLIDLERELAAKAEGPAHAFLDSRAAESLFITFTIAGEIAAGVGPAHRQRWEKFVAPFEVLACTSDVCWEYGQAFRFLRANGVMIGSNDLWIAATALAYRKAVVTRTAREFSRVPGLEVVSYRTP